MTFRFLEIPPSLSLPIPLKGEGLIPILSRMVVKSHFRALVLAALLLAGGILLAGNAFCRAADVDETRIREVVAAHGLEKMRALFPEEKNEYIAITPVVVPRTPLQFPNLSSTDGVRITATSRLGETYSERGVIRVRLEAPNGEVREMGVPVQIVIRKPVWVVRNTVLANAPLHPSDLALETRDVSHSYRYAAGADKNPANYVARVNMWPGETLDLRKMIIPPDVTSQGEIHILLANANGMTLTVPGIALANGRIGEIIRVRQTVFQRKYYNAKVIDRNRVLVEI